MSVFECFTSDWQEGDYLMAESVTIDLATPEGFAALEKRASDDIFARYFQGPDAAKADTWNRLAGRSLADVAAEWARDLMQESVSIPRSAFADHERAGRELAIIQRVAAYVYRHILAGCVAGWANEPGFTFPSGHTPLRPPAQQRQQHSHK